jgi:phenylacetate-CoA ligase
MAWVWGNQKEMAHWAKQTRLKAMLKQERYLNAYSMTETKMQAFAEMLVRWQPVIIKGYSVALSLLAGYIKQHQIMGIRPQLVEATAEKLKESQRQLLEQIFGCPVADVYSCHEFGAIAYQCPTGQLHVSEPHFLEIVAKGQVVEPGQLGEVVVTFLPQFPMPLIRYKLKDMAAWETSPWSCGRSMPALREVVGRTTDFVVTADGQFVSSAFFSHVFRSKREVARYQVFQSDRTHVQVRLVCAQKVDAAWLDRVGNELRDRLGVDMQIAINLVDAVESTPAGKYRYVISNIKPDFL